VLGVQQTQLIPLTEARRQAFIMDGRPPLMSRLDTLPSNGRL
jgi:hypothetical protein